MATIVSLPIIRQTANIVYKIFANWRFERATHCKTNINKEEKIMILSKEMQNIIDTYNLSKFPSYSSLSPVELRQTFNETFHKKPKETPIKMAKIDTKVIGR